jgi:RNA polymerase sigma-70 factor (ECF subfamily)
MKTVSDDDSQVNQAWTAHRSYLIDLAFRMLGDIGEAEDVVQEAFHRLSQTDFDAIEDERGWLIVVTSRLCLDVIRSARARREISAGADAGPFEQASELDPADRVTLDDSVRLALLVLLERLSPAERVTYVLHDIFQVPFDAIATTVGRPEANCRQLARRARLKLEAPDGGPRFEVTEIEHKDVTDRFIAACANGNFEQLVEVLDPDVWGQVDVRPGFVLEGSDRVAANLIRRFGPRANMVSLPIAGKPCVLVFVERDIEAVLELTVADGRVTTIQAQADPAKLRFLRTQLRPQK